MKIRSTVEENEVTVWLPLNKGWPVVSVSIVDETTKHLLWVLVHESFKEAVNDGDGTVALTITRLAATHRAVMPTDVAVGDAPRKMAGGG